MAAPIPLRDDYDGLALRSLAKVSKDARQTRRLLALAVIYDGGSRSEAAKVGGVGLQVIRDWVVRFNAEGPPGLLDRKAPGARRKLTEEHRRALAARVDQGPIPAIDGVVRWRRKDLAQWLHDEFGLVVAETTVGRALRAMGYRRLTARPRHHAQNEFALEAFKIYGPPPVCKSERADGPLQSASIYPASRWASCALAKTGIRASRS